MKKVSINSDLELELLLLTDEGKEKYTKGDPLDIVDIVNPENEFIKVRLIQNKDGKEFEAINAPNEESIYCYIGNMTIGEFDFPTLIVTIPENTFNEEGYLWICLGTREVSDKFEDGYKNTEGILEKTEVFYVVQ